MRAKYEKLRVWLNNAISDLRKINEMPIWKLFCFSCYIRIKSLSDSLKILLETNHIPEAFGISRSLLETLFYLSAGYRNKYSFDEFLKRNELQYFKEKIKLLELSYILNAYSQYESEKQFIDKLSKAMNEQAELRKKKINIINDYSVLSEEAGLWPLYCNQYTLLSSNFHGNMRTIETVLGYKSENTVYYKDLINEDDPDSIYESASDSLTIANSIIDKVFDMNKFEIKIETIYKDMENRKIEINQNKKKWDELIKTIKTS